MTSHRVQGARQVRQVRRARTALVASAALIALLLTACGSDDGGEETASDAGTDEASDGAAAAGDGELDQVAVTVFPAGYVGAQLHLGEDAGIFAEHGLTVEVIEGGSPSAVVPAVSSGEVQFGYSGPTSIMIARSQGLGVQLVSGTGVIEVEEPEVPGQYTNGVWARADSGITSWADLNDQTMPIICVRCDAELYQRYAIDKNGGDSSTTEFIAMAPADIYDALTNEQIEVGPLNNPFSLMAWDDPELVNIGAHLSEFGPAPITVVFGNEEWMNENSDIAGRFQAAMHELIPYLGEHVDDLRATTAEYYPISEEEAAELQYVATFVPDLLPDTLRTYHELLLDYEFIEEPIVFEDLFFGNEVPEQ